jgi:hypothetical protein
MALPTLRLWACHVHGVGYLLTPSVVTISEDLTTPHRAVVGHATLAGYIQMEPTRRLFRVITSQRLPAARSLNFVHFVSFVVYPVSVPSTAMYSDRR